MKDKEKQIEFSVIDNETGEYPDLYKIALKEEWAKGLMYCDMEGFAINEDGQLILSDECGKFVYCPSDRFTVVFEDSVVLSREEYTNYMVEYMGVKEIKERVSKETAEKFYEFAKAWFVDEEQNDYFVEVENLAKQFGVEIKEL